MATQALSQQAQPDAARADLASHDARRRMTVPHTSSFAVFANKVSRLVGHPGAFIAAGALVVVWLLAGPIFRFSDSWQLVINTSTTIITFLMVFLIQNTQNRDAHAMQLKLDEIIRSIEGAHLALLDLEELSESEIAEMHSRYSQLARRAREDMRRGVTDTGTPRLPD